jgi:DNA helicase-2/ATP-dependent DNA helicase PcrA
MAGLDLAALNVPQRQAVEADPGAVLVLAGPGSGESTSSLHAVHVRMMVKRSLGKLINVTQLVDMVGKTKVITARAAWLIDQGVPPWSICLMTFTNKAASEMLNRLQAMIGESANSVLSGTFHSIACLMLHRYGKRIGLSERFNIADQTDQVSIMKRIFKDHQDHDLTPGWMDEKPKQLIGKIGRYKTEELTPDLLDRSLSSGRLDPSEQRARAKIIEPYRLYQAMLADSDLLDFNDLLIQCLKLFMAHPDVLKNLEHILVDEFQDTNLVQFKICSGWMLVLAVHVL